MEAQPNYRVGAVLYTELTKMLDEVVLPEISETHEQCIYKVPQKIRQSNPQAYTPRVISIGPFHSPRGSIRDNDNLSEMEELKLKYLKWFLSRTNLSVDALVIKVLWLEKTIRNCYAGLGSFDSKDFVKIIIVDSCFIIEHFLRFLTVEDFAENDPIFLKRGLYIDIFRDLILLENQLPFFILEEIYSLANIQDHAVNVIDEPLPHFLEIAINYFQELYQYKSYNHENSTPTYSQLKNPKHFTDLLRNFFLPASFDSIRPKTGNRFFETQHVYSTSQLLEVGLKFELSESKFLFDLEFKNGVLKMPCFKVSDATERYMRNIIAFEECHISDQDSYIVQYFSILDFLINNEKDVRILVDKNIIVNWMNDDNEVATMVNNLCTNIRMPNLNPKYLKLCLGLNEFYEDSRNKYKAIFVRDYFNTPWKIASTITAVLLLLFTLIQAVCSIWSLVKS